MRYFLGFSYKGTSYHGWQIQPNAITVQEVLEDRMSKLLGNEIKLIGAGRTDAGVHAKFMIAHFDADISDIEKFIYRLNSFLPQDIAVHSLQEMKPDAHARFDATERTYHYYINYKKDPFKTELSWLWNYEALDVVKMNEAAALLLKFDDFTSFARLHTDNKTNICNVRYAVWSEENGNLKFEITSDRFLRNMVRSIVGTLVEIGKGKISLDEFIEIIEKKDRKFAAASAPAHGLFLTHVAYPKDLYL